jgi:hypothetical protein
VGIWKRLVPVSCVGLPVTLVWGTVALVDGPGGDPEALNVAEVDGTLVLGK